MLTPEFPDGSHGTPQLISINKGDELIFYEAANSTNGAKGIWKYLSSNNSWNKIGEMLHTRNDFIVLPVDDISCPQDNK